MRAEEVAGRLDTDVEDEECVACGDQLLRASLRKIGGAAAAAEQPDDDAAGERLDDGVDAEADQRDRAGRDAGAERDRELDDMPGVAAPGQQLGAPLERRPLLWRAWEPPLEPDAGAQAVTSDVRVSSRSWPRSVSE